MEFAPTEVFSIAIDGLYQPINYHVYGSSLNTHTTGSAWAFPLRLKFAIRQGYVRPFIAAGASARLLANLHQTVAFVPGYVPLRPVPQSSSRPVELQNRFTIGFVAGGGVEVGIRHLHVAPEFRYTRWAWQNTVNPTNNLNEAEFLVSFRF